MFGRDISVARQPVSNPGSSIGWLGDLAWRTLSVPQCPPLFTGDCLPPRAVEGMTGAKKKEKHLW